jgi:hypothetical protein
MAEPVFEFSVLFEPIGLASTSGEPEIVSCTRPHELVHASQRLVPTSTRTMHASRRLVPTPQRTWHTPRRTVPTFPRMVAAHNRTGAGVRRTCVGLPSKRATRPTSGGSRATTGGSCPVIGDLQLIPTRRPAALFDALGASRLYEMRSSLVQCRRGRLVECRRRISTGCRGVAPGSPGAKSEVIQRGKVTSATPHRWPACPPTRPA